MKISIEELENAQDQQETLKFNEIIDDLENGKPVEGVITARLAPYGVEIEGHVETDILLECDRCLVKFPYHVNIDIDEKFIKGSLASENTKELELTEETFVEELGGKTEIDITDLIYQSVILETPSQKLCNIECPGSEALNKFNEEKPIDPRLEIFKKMSENRTENKDNK